MHVILFLIVTISFVTLGHSLVGDLRDNGRVTIENFILFLILGIIIAYYYIVWLLTISILLIGFHLVYILINRYTNKDTHEAA